MVKVRLTEWCDRWKYGNPDDKDFFSIVAGEEKEATDEIFALAMGRLVKIRIDAGQIIPPVKKDVAKSKK